MKRLIKEERKPSNDGTAVGVMSGFKIPDNKEVKLRNGLVLQIVPSKHLLLGTQAEIHEDLDPAYHMACDFHSWIKLMCHDFESSTEVKAYRGTWSIGVKNGWSESFMLNEYFWSFYFHKLLQFGLVKGWDFYDVDKKFLYENSRIEEPYGERFDYSKLKGTNYYSPNKDPLKEMNGFDYKPYSTIKGYEPDPFFHSKCHKLHKSVAPMFIRRTDGRGYMEAFIKKQWYFLLMHTFLDIGEKQGWNYFNPSQNVIDFITAKGVVSSFPEHLKIYKEDGTRDYTKELINIC